MGLSAAWQIMGLTQPGVRTYRGLSVIEESSLGRAQNDILRVMMNRRRKSHQILQYRWGACIGLNGILLMSSLEYPFTSQSIRQQVSHLRGTILISPYYQWLTLRKTLSIRGWSFVYRGFLERRIYELMCLFTEYSLGGFLVNSHDDINKQRDGSSQPVLKRFLILLIMKFLTVSLTLPFYRSWIISILISNEENHFMRNTSFWVILLDSMRWMFFNGSSSKMMRNFKTILIPKFIHDIIEENLGQLVEDYITESLRSTTTDFKEDTPVFYTFFPRLVGYVGGMTVTRWLLYPILTYLHRSLKQTLSWTDSTSETQFRLTLLWDNIKIFYLNEGLLSFYSGFSNLLLQTVVHAALLELSEWLFKRMFKPSQEISSS